jgi:hypothetical protein
VAVHVLQNCAVWHGSADLTAQANSVEVGQEIAEVDNTTFSGNGFASALPGLKSATINYQGFADFENGSDLELFTLASSDANVATVAFDQTIGARAWHSKGMNATFAPLSGSVGEIAQLTGTLHSSQSAFGLRSGAVIANKAARTTTVSTTGQQLFTAGTVTLLTAAAHFFVVSGTTPSCVVTVQSSATQGGSYTTRGTFPAQTTAGGAYISAAISTTEQWFRATFTISGSSPSFTAAVSAAVSP